MDNFCKICNLEINERSHFWKNHKIKEKDYYEKYYPKFDLYDKSLIIFKSPEQYELADFQNKINLKKYLELNSKEYGLNYLKNYLKRRKELKYLDFSLSEFECKSLLFPSLIYWNKKYGIDSYKEICLYLGLQFRYDYKIFPTFNKNIENRSYICDTREQNILKLPNMQIAKLEFGDYTLEKSKIFIERKSLTDIIGTLSSGYIRFNKEIERCKNNNSYLIILIEEKYNNFQSFEYMPHIHSKCTWDFISHRFRELIQKYPTTIQFLSVDGRKEAIRVIDKIFKINNSILISDLQYLYNSKNL